MFGLERIGWLLFIKVVLVILIAWYLVLFISYWWKKSFQSISKTFEKDIEEDHAEQELRPLSSSCSFPLGNISSGYMPGIVLPVTSTNESEQEDGVALEHILDGKGISSEELLKQMQIIR